MTFCQKEKVWKYQARRIFPCQDWLAQEKKIEIYVGRTKQSELICSPVRIDEIALGWMIYQRLLPKRGVIYWKWDEKKSQLIFSSKIYKLKTQIMPTFKENICLSPKLIFKISKELDRKGKIFQKTGGVHCAGLFSQRGALLEFAEDISRRSSLIRLLGRIKKKGIDPAGKIVMVSGRVFKEMVEALVWLGIKVLLSPSAPSRQAVDYARHEGIALIGFVRGKEFNIYSLPEQVKIT